MSEIVERVAGALFDAMQTEAVRLGAAGAVPTYDEDDEDNRECVRRLARAAIEAIGSETRGLREALADARFAIGVLETQLTGFAEPAINVSFFTDKIDAALSGEK